MIIWIFFIVIWYSSLFSQTFFQHRYAAHGAFSMSKGWERFFFIVTYITQGSSYMSPKTYGIMHRLHHAHTDTELDPHSPAYSSNVFSMMWRTRTFYLDIYNKKMKVDARFSKNLPEWETMDRIGNSRLSRILWVVAYTAFFYFFATNPWQYVLLPIIITMGAFHGAIINWFAHKYGYTNFKLKNTSMNLLFADVLMLGESYHNNHHKHPSSANFGYRWFEIDPTYPLIKLLVKMKIIRMSKPAVEAAQHKQEW
ncbi:acyl-CoA desaturase [Filimonas effusa]|uniref:Acyl-CoA desaturase n=1 Tax=Filimonas effusa TaxID=2508721 RepID=A0A4Q1D455_9BACT|nr:acyl-CoA desaturase [Filimonas effusa]RXK83128.1 acyl-CoA desaturase [Filimonas effusa]